MEEAQHPPDFMSLLKEISTDDVERFFREVVKKSACPICGDALVAFTDMRHIPDGHIKASRKKPAILMRPIHTPPEHHNIVRLPVIPACCDTCGFMAEFSVAPLLEWKAAGHGG